MIIRIPAKESARRKGVISHPHIRAIQLKGHVVARTGAAAEGAIDHQENPAPNFQGSRPPAHLPPQAPMGQRERTRSAR